MATSKYKSKSIQDDPLQYHAKPKDLSRNALPAPTDFSTKKESREIFTQSSFDSFPMDSRLLDLIQRHAGDGGMGLVKTTSVQSAVIPALIKREVNVFMKSQTGSGKTLAYLLPIVNDLMLLQPVVQRSQGTRALIIAPTRELCGQITETVEKLTQCCCRLVSGSITGGEKRKSEKARLRKGVVILTATPGRLLDHLKTTESFQLKHLRWIVLDEADRLLDLGRCSY
jgi:ATP-dependent RNA helicase DDX31/DBP7